MKPRMRLIELAVVPLSIAVLAAMVGAQGPRGPAGLGRDGFGPGPAGVPFISSQGPAFQAMYSRTRDENIVNNGTAGTIATAASGAIARGSDGSTYVSETRPNPRAASSASATSETVFIRNVTAMKNYVIHVARQTYEEFPLRSRRPGNAPAHSRANNAPAPTPYDFKDSASGFTCAAEETKISHTIQPPAAPGGNSNPPVTVTEDRIYCPALSVVVQETRTDPRFGTTSYVLSGITTGSPIVSFAPPGNYTLAKSRAPWNRAFSPSDPSAQ